MKLQWLPALSLGFLLVFAGCSKEEEDPATSATELTAPEVSTTSPADGDESVSITKSLSITFSLAMDTATLTTNEGSKKCTGSIQLSSDEFASCVALGSTVSSSSNQKTFIAAPETDLAYDTSYELKVTTDAASSEGAALAEDTTISFTTVAETTSDSTTTDTTTTTTTTTDSTAPTAGNSGTFSVTSVSYTTAYVSWTLGSDETTSQASLTHTLYFSTSNVLNSVANVKAYGSAPTTSSSGSGYATLSNLSPGTTYYFNIIVKDAAGNEAIYSSQTATTSSAIVMFEKDGVDGNLGGRSGADALCTTAKSTSQTHLVCTNIRAFISVSATDEIQDMPSNYSVPTGIPILGPTGIQFASNWTDLLNGGALSYTLSSAGINSNSAGWFSGSDYTGAVSANTCNAWAYNAGYAYYGRGGFKTGDYANWIDQSNYSCNFASYSILCLCYQ